MAARLIERRMDVQVAISQFVADATASRCVVIHNGVRPAERAEQRGDAVLMLQRLEPEKDTGTALRAWALSGLADQGWRLVIHGRGSDETTMHTLARSLGVSANVEFAGVTDKPRLALARASLLLAPAPAEPFGLAVVEAMAEGTPVVAADGGAHRETVGPDGAFFKPGDAEECAAILVRLAGAAAEREAIGSRLQARQRDLFSISAHVDRLEGQYRPSAQRRGRPA